MDDISQHSKDVAKGSLWSLAGSITFHLISFFYVILIARALSQDDLGIFFLSLSIVSLGAILDNLGLGSALSRYVPYYEGKNEKGKIKSLLKISYVMVTVSAIILMLLLWSLADFIAGIYQNPQLAEVIRLLSAYLLLSNLFNLNLAYLRGRTDMKAMQYSQNAQNGLKLVLTATFFYLYGPSVFTLIAAFLLSFLLSIILSSFFVIKKTSDLTEPPRAVQFSLFFSEILPFGIMLSLIYSLGATFSSANNMLLGYLVDPAESTQIVAIYAVSATLAGLLMTFPNAIGAIFLPIISRLYGKNDLPQICSVTETAQRWSLFLTVPVGIMMISFSGDILALIYGEAYRGGAMAMAILTLGFLVRMVSYLLSLALAAMRLVKVQLKILAVSGLGNLLLSALLIPVFGMVGSAIGSLLGFVISLLLLNHFAKKHIGFRFPSKMYKLGACAFLTLIAMLLLSPLASNLFLQIPEFGTGDLQLYASKILQLGYLGILAAVSTAFFTIFVFLFRCLSKEDVSLMRQAMQKVRLPPLLISNMEKIASYGVSR